MGSSISQQKTELPFTDKNLQHHLDQVKKLHTKTSKARRRVLQNLNSSEPLIDIAKEALMLAEQTTYFEQLIAHYPARPEVWELYASFQELTHNELAADQCHKKVATLRHVAAHGALRRIASMSAQVSPRADVANVFIKKTQEVIAKDQELRDNAPHEFLCPITLEIMVSPVIAPDGFTYEETAIKEWLAKNNRSPLTNLQIGSKVLKRNYALHAAITTYLECN